MSNNGSTLYFIIFFSIDHFVSACGSKKCSGLGFQIEQIKIQNAQIKLNFRQINNFLVQHFP